MSIALTIVLCVVACAIGSGAGIGIFIAVKNKKSKSANDRAEKIINDARAQADKIRKEQITFLS